MVTALLTAIKRVQLPNIGVDCSMRGAVRLVPQVPVGCSTRATSYGNSQQKFVELCHSLYRNNNVVPG